MQCGELEGASQEQDLGILSHSAILSAMIYDLAAKLATWKRPSTGFVLHPECNTEDDSSSLKYT